MMEEINTKLEELKPYTKERSDLTKTKPKFPMCCKRYYRFLKEPRGVLPTVIQNLLDARKHTRKVDMVECYKKIDALKADTSVDHSKEIEELNSLINVLDKRQLAYKVSANSMYGAMGVRKGYLPFMPGAMCTTYMGRVNIDRVAKEITTTYKGTLVYGDTDSNYITFPHLKTAEETWDYAIDVAAKISKMFPKPIKLEFEEAIYSFFFILTKKRYMYQKCLRDGIIDTKIGKKGVLLARRDNSKFVRDVYEGVISRIADDMSRDEIVYWVLQNINGMFSGCKPHSDFIVTKAVGDSGGLKAESFTNEKGVKKAKVGDYTVPALSNIKE
jgi:DNA polymerase elongation subunit (family B)